MKNNLPPLHYAIIECFNHGEELSANDVIAALKEDYSGYKLLNNKDVDEALATSRENGLLEETKVDVDDEGRLRIFYKMTAFGTDMVHRYLG